MIFLCIYNIKLIIIKRVFWFLMLINRLKYINYEVFMFRIMNFNMVKIFLFMERFYNFLWM